MLEEVCSHTTIIFISVRKIDKLRIPNNRQPKKERRKKTNKQKDCRKRKRKIKADHQDENCNVLAYSLNA
jgi:hypothetical protein